MKKWREEKINDKLIYEWIDKRMHEKITLDELKKRHLNKGKEKWMNTRICSKNTKDCIDEYKELKEWEKIGKQANKNNDQI